MIVAGKEKEGVHVGRFSGWHTLIYSLAPDTAANPVLELTWLARGEHEGHHCTFYRTCKCCGVSVNVGVGLLPLDVENY